MRFLAPFRYSTRFRQALNGVLGSLFVASLFVCGGWAMFFAEVPTP